MPSPLPTRLASTLGFRRSTVLTILREVFREFLEHEILTRCAAIAFYAMLAFVPLLAVLLAISVQLYYVSSFLPPELRWVEVQTINELKRGLSTIIPADAYEVVQLQIERMRAAHPVTVLSIGSILSLWVSSSLFMSIMDALNRIYGFRDRRSYWQRRALAMLMTLVQSVFVLGCLASIVAWPQFMSRLGLVGITSMIVSTLHMVAAFAVTLVSFALTFQIGPPSKQRMFWITPGSFFGAVIFIAISFGFRLYVQNFGAYDRVYGSLGGVMVLLLWFYLTSAVILGAAATNKVLEVAHERGPHS
ncbi:MAG: YihY/virulence factor BrkB family protein [Candidatus Melainabacteria bacterium]|nr:MAG: YihY/virulence factor BrkB family protein [Candidatus Melainabacteria bacterium]